MSSRPSGDAAGRIWGRPAPGVRRPRYSRELIASAALGIADEEGFGAVSMRRVAAALGAGTMTLYHYVRTKDELVDLMDDAIMGEVLIPPEELADDWREALAQIARSSYGAWARHPWAFEAMRGARFSPNGIRHFEQSLAAVASLPVALEERFAIVSLVDDYVFGYVSRWGGASADERPTEDQFDDMRRLFDAELALGDHPQLEALFAGGDVHSAWRRLESVVLDPDRFERGLQRLLAGIALDVA